MRVALVAATGFAATALWLILCHRFGLHGAAKYGGEVASAWLGVALGEAAIS